MSTKGQWFKAWITKYALTQGIYEIEVRRCDTNPAEHSYGMVEDKVGPGQMSNYYHGEGNEWHQTESDAIKKALDIADKKLKALRNQIKNIEMKQAFLRNRRDKLHAEA